MISTKNAAAGLIVVFLMNIYPGSILQWYARYPSFDIFLHFLGGFFIAMLIFSYYHKEFKKLPQHMQFFAIIGMTMGIGVIWEFGEYIASQTLRDLFLNKYSIRVYFIGDLGDTMADLLMDTLGGITFWVLHLIGHANSQKRQPQTNNFIRGNQ